MARSRNIKPSIMENEELADLDPIARLLFIYLWMLADREGRLEDRPKRIAGRALPYDRDADVGDLLNHLANAGFITRYKVGELAIIQINNFAKHQSPHVRESASELPSIEQGTAKVVTRHDLGSAETSPRSPDSLFLIPDSLIPLPEKTSCSPSASELANNRFAEFWSAYDKKVGKSNSLKEWKKINPDADLINRIVSAAKTYSSSTEQKYRKDPERWLKGRMWQDEGMAGVSEAKPDWMAGAL